MILKFFLSYKEEGFIEYETNFKKISKRYFKGKFKLDLLLLIPFALIGHIYQNLSFFKCLWLIKMTRLESIFRILDQKYYMPILRNLQNRKTAGVLNDERKKDDQSTDHLQMHYMIHTSNAIMLFKLCILLFLISFYIGILYYMIADYIN